MTASHPQRVVCLTEETTEWLCLPGQEQRIVAIGGCTVRQPRVRQDEPHISSFFDGRIDRIVPPGMVSSYWWRALPKVNSFIVHWLASISPSAPKIAFVTHIEVWTLPTTPAPGGRGCGSSMQPSGTTVTRSGFNQPAFRGMSSS